MNILLVGEHPQGISGNSHMMAATVRQIDTSKHNVAVFAAGMFRNVKLWQMNPKVQVIDGMDLEMDEPTGAVTRYDSWGGKRLMNTLSTLSLDLVVFVGIDVWRYVPFFDQINQIRAKNRFKLGAIFPYDLPYLRSDWLAWISFFDYPMVYSKFGYKLLKPRLPKVDYYRPALFEAEKFKTFSAEDKLRCRRTYFPTVPEDFLIFGFVGKNQFRKDPQRLIKAFMLAKKQYPKMTLYLHVEPRGVYNLEQIMNDYGGQTGDFVVHPGVGFDTEKMVNLYNSFDCLINCTMNEGLSWTVVEAQLCGVPVIASDSTSHTELLENGGGILVPCKELAYLPVITRGGSSWVETNACRLDAMVNAILTMARSKEERQKYSEEGTRIGREWVAGVSDFNAKFLSFGERKIKKEVLFIQHSAAGDVFMTTKALAGLKKRHPDMPLVYMTQMKYHDILVGNPNVDRIIDYSFSDMGDYTVIYNPHGERIMPGHWGRNSNSLLSDFYWKILEVEKGDFFIEQVAPPLGLIAKTPLTSTSKRMRKLIAVLHTTGGDPRFRTYQYMGVVAKGLREKGYYTIQLGGKNDYPADADLDLRGMLSFRESAWVMGKARIAVTVDSFISHLAGALGVSQVCLFGSGNQFVVKPDQVEGKLICLSPDYVRYCPGLGPCSGSVRDCPHTCTGMHDPKTILEKIEEIEGEEENEQHDNCEQYAERDRATA